MLLKKCYDLECCYLGHFQQLHTTFNRDFPDIGGGGGGSGSGSAVTYNPVTPLSCDCAKTLIKSCALAFHPVAGCAIAVTDLGTACTVRFSRAVTLFLQSARLENVKIPDGFNYDLLKSLSFEAREKLESVRPVTVSQASRISGVSPSDISVLLVHLGR